MCPRPTTRHGLADHLDPCWPTRMFYAGERSAL